MAARAKISPAAKRRRQLEIANARTCPVAFVEYVAPELCPLAPVHVEWLRTWQTCPQSVTQSSIGLGKSTLVRFFLLWLLGRDSTEMVIWVGATQKQPRQNLGSIKSIIESPEYRHRVHHVFPHLRPGRSWTSVEIEVSREIGGADKDPSIAVYGAFSDGVLGSRATTLVIDDICTWNNTLTEDSREKTITWLSTVFSRLTKANVRVIVLGNYWHKDDALMHLARKPGFVFSRVPAYTLDADGNRVPTAPQCLSIDKIQRLEAQLGALQAERQLLCRAAASDVGRFRSTYFAAALEAGRGQPFRPSRITGACYTGVDLGHTKKAGSDRTAMVTCMILSDGRRQIVDVRAGRWDSVEIRRNLAEVYAAYQPIIGVESNGGQQMIADLMSEALAIPLNDHHTGVNKYHFAYGVESLANELAQGFWIFPCPRSPTIDEPGEGPGEWSLESKAAGQPHHEVVELINEALVCDLSKRQHTGDRLMAWWICAETLRRSAAGVLLGQPGGAGAGADFDWMAR